MSKMTENHTHELNRPSLTDADRYPDDRILKEALGESYVIYASFMITVQAPPFDLIPEWNFYKDGKAWLCKVTFKKKTVFWLSVWQGCFKISFYFTEKHVEDIKAIEIDDAIKQDFLNRKTIGKLIPMVIEVAEAGQIKDVLKVVEYKKSK